MSYSFGVRGKDKAEALARIKEEMEKVVANQPIHGNDAPVVVDAAEKLLALLPTETETARQIAVSVNGSIWSTDNGVQSVSASISASLA